VSLALLLTVLVGVAEAQPLSPAFEARTVLLPARSGASTIGQSHTRARALREIAWAQHRAGDRTEALHTLESATLAGLRIEDENWRLDAVADVLFLQIHMGDTAGARTRAASLFRGLVPSPLPWLLLEADQPAAARVLMNELEPQRRPELLAAIAVMPLVAVAGTLHWPDAEPPWQPHAITPPSFRARLWERPAVIALTPLEASGGTLHWPKSRLKPPFEPQPQATTLPSLFRARLW